MQTQFLSALVFSFASTAAFAEEYTQVSSVTIIPSDDDSYCPSDIKLVEVHSYYEGGSKTKAHLETSALLDVKLSFHASTEKTVTWAVKFADQSFDACNATAAVRMMLDHGGVVRHSLYRASFKDGTLLFTFDMTAAGDNGAITYQNIKDGNAVWNFSYAD